MKNVNWLLLSVILVLVLAAFSPICPPEGEVNRYFFRGFGALSCGAAKPLAFAAQDVPEATPEVTEAITAVATAVVEPTVEATPVPLSESDRVSFSWTVMSQVLMAIVVSFMAGGLTVGGGILLALRTILKSSLLSNMVEKLFLSQPPSNREKQRGVIQGLKEVAEGIDKLTDGELIPDGEAVG